MTNGEHEDPEGYRRGHTGILCDLMCCLRDLRVRRSRDL